jgi:hypothetical protein
MMKQQQSTTAVTTMATEGTTTPEESQGGTYHGANKKRFTEQWRLIGDFSENSPKINVRAVVCATVPVHATYHMVDVGCTADASYVVLIPLCVFV